MKDEDQLGSVVGQACAEALYRELSNLENKNGWVVHEKEFLPANVCCDYAGQRWFINLMARVITKTLAEQPQPKG